VILIDDLTNILSLKIPHKRLYIVVLNLVREYYWLQQRVLVLNGHWHVNLLSFRILKSRCELVSVLKVFSIAKLGLGNVVLALLMI